MNKNLTLTLAEYDFMILWSQYKTSNYTYDNMRFFSGRIQEQHVKFMTTIQGTRVIEKYFYFWYVNLKYVSFL